MVKVLGSFEVLIISYETFPMHSSKFCQSESCDLLLCDEVCRLKNDQTLTNKTLASLTCYGASFVVWNTHAGCYDCASRQRRSGETEDDVMELAYKLYFQDQKVKFTLEHAWRLLKNDQKWCSLVTNKSNPVTKKSKGADGVAYSASSNTGCQVEEETIERPMGVKAAKAKGKKRRNQTTEDSEKRRNQTTEDSESSSLRDLEELWIIKENNLVIKERLSKQKLLDSLIAKSGPLSEIEETLKNKLITEML